MEHDLCDCALGAGLRASQSNGVRRGQRQIFKRIERSGLLFLQIAGLPVKVRRISPEQAGARRQEQKHGRTEPEVAVNAAH